MRSKFYSHRSITDVEDIFVSFFGNCYTEIPIFPLIERRFFFPGVKTQRTLLTSSSPLLHVPIQLLLLSQQSILRFYNDIFAHISSIGCQTNSIAIVCFAQCSGNWYTITHSFRQMLLAMCQPYAALLPISNYVIIR